MKAIYNNGDKIYMTTPIKRKVFLKLFKSVKQQFVMNTHFKHQLTKTKIHKFDITTSLHI